MVVENGVRKSSRRSTSKYKSYNLDALSKASSNVNTQDQQAEKRRQQTEAEKEATSNSDHAPSSVEESESEPEQEEDDEEYVESGSKRAKKQGNSPAKRRKRKPAVSAAEMGEDFEENMLYKALTDPEASVLDLVMEWVESYVEDQENDGLESITNLVNLVVRSCGCVTMLNPHNLSNLDSAPQTVEELVIAFKEQRSHEYPFISNNKDVKFFKTNVLEFFKKLFQISHTRGLLYIEVGSNEKGESFTSPFVNQVFTWLLTMTTCIVRPLRYVSTAILLAIQTELCDIIADTADVLEKNQRKLTSAQNAKRKSKANIETVAATVTDLTHQKHTIEEYFDDVVDVVLAHRYRDIDPLIRQKCVVALGDWAVTYPDMFMQNTYLRYFGWLLSDPNSHVRGEVSKSLGTVFKYCVSHGPVTDTTLRQFTERYKSQIVQMCYKDVDFSVRNHLVSVLNDLVRLSFLTYEEQISIVSNFLRLVKVGTGFSKANDEKLRYEYSKFIQTVHTSSMKAAESETEDLALTVESSMSFDVRKAYKFKSLIDILKAAETLETEAIASEEIKEPFPASRVFQSLYPLAMYSESWRFLVQYFSFDLSSITLSNPEEDVEQFLQKLDVSSDDNRRYLLQLILGSVSSVFNRKKADSEIDNPENLMNNILEDLRPLVTESLKDPDHAVLFARIWTVMMNSRLNVYTVFLNAEQSDLYHEITVSLLRFYQDLANQGDVEAAMEVFGEFFSVLFKEHHSLMPTEIKSVMDNVVSILLDEVESALKTPDVTVVNKLEETSFPLRKLNILASFLEDNSSVASVATFFIDEVLEPFKVSALLKEDVLQLNTRIDEIASVIKQFFDTILILNASSLERIFDPQTIQGDIDIASEFGKTLEVVQHVVQKFEDFDTCCNTLNEQIGSSSLPLSVKETRTLIEKVRNLQFTYTISFIDIVVSLKLFHEKFKSTNSFVNFYEFFDKDEVRSLSIGPFPFSLQNALMSLFLVKESQLASASKVELDRTAVESVSVMEEDEDTNVTFDDGNDDESLHHQRALREARARKERDQQIWKAEKDLCLYTIKLYSLVNLSMVGDSVTERIQLNSKKLGGLFTKIVDQFKKEEAGAVDSQEPVKENGTAAEASPEPERSPEPVEDSEQAEN